MFCSVSFCTDLVLAVLEDVDSSSAAAAGGLQGEHETGQVLSAGHPYQQVSASNRGGCWVQKRSSVGHSAVP